MTKSDGHILLMSETMRPFPDSLDNGAGFDDCTLLRESPHSRIYTAVRNGRKYILKAAASDSGKDIARLKREFEICTDLYHDGLSRALSYEEESPVGPCIVEKYIEGDSLDKWLAGKPSLRARKKVFGRLMDVVEYIHGQGVIHNDLAPGNILITPEENEVKIIDFGFADDWTHYVAKGIGGTEGYASPELAGKSGRLDGRSDIWTLGALMRDLFGERYGAVSRKCLADSPDDRFSTVPDLRRAWKARLAAPRVVASVAALSVLVSIPFVLSSLKYHVPLAVRASIPAGNSAVAIDNGGMPEKMSPSISIIDTTDVNGNYRFNAKIDRGRFTWYTGTLDSLESRLAVSPFLKPVNLRVRATDLRYTSGNVKEGCLFLYFPPYQYLEPSMRDTSTFFRLGRVRHNRVKLYSLSGTVSFRMDAADIVRIELSGNDMEFLYGMAAVNMQGDVPNIVDRHDDVNTMSYVLYWFPKAADKFSPGTYLVNVPPVSFKSGFRLTFTDSSGRMAEYLVRDACSVPQGGVLDIGEIPLRDMKWYQVEEIRFMDYVCQPFSERGWPFVTPEIANVPNTIKDGKYAGKRLKCLTKTGYEPVLYGSETICRTNPYCGFRVGKDGSYIELPGFPGRKISRLTMVNFPYRFSPSGFALADTEGRELRYVQACESFGTPVFEDIDVQPGQGLRITGTAFNLFNLRIWIE